MSARVLIKDETTAGKVIHTLQFEVAQERLCIRDLIRLRVHEEVSLYNLSTPGYFNGLVQPTDAEVTLNGYKLRQRRKLDWEQQADRAVQAFQENGFFILVDDRQVEDLDEMIEIQPETHISFVKLFPLVGG